MFDYFSFDFLGGVASTLTIASVVIGAWKYLQHSKKGVKYAVSTRTIFDEDLPFAIESQFRNDVGASHALTNTRFLFRNETDITLNDQEFVTLPNINVEPGTLIFGIDQISKLEDGTASTRLRDNKIEIHSIALASGEAIVLDIFHSGGVGAAINGLPKTSSSIKKTSYRSRARTEVAVLAGFNLCAIALGFIVITKIMNSAPDSAVMPSLIGMLCAYLAALILFFSKFEDSPLSKRLARISHADEIFRMPRSAIKSTRPERLSLEHKDSLQIETRDEVKNSSEL